jgi:hypothetical protein
MKLNLSAFALAFGIWWGGGIFFLTWWLIATGNTTGEASALIQIYPGYSVTALGSLVGLVWGFVCGLICGGILACLYNFLADSVGTGNAKK